MSPEILFPLQLVLGYVAWLLCFGLYALPWLSSIDRVDAQRAIATLHSFRFFGLVFILQAWSVPISPLTSPRSLPTGTWRPAYWPCWHCSP